MNTFAEKAIAFHHYLELETQLNGVEVMNPFRNAETVSISERFFTKFFNDNNKRIFIFGINPGRFGAGLTGISFTDPIRLEKNCGITNSLPKKPELSSEFIYKMIESYGSVFEFYSNFFVTAVSPLGFLKEGKNLNYYDTKELHAKVTPFILQSIQQQIGFGAFHQCAICLGGDKNFRFLNQLNQKYSFFENIFPLDHPRFIMQYRRKTVNEFISRYLKVMDECQRLIEK